MSEENEVYQDVVEETLPEEETTSEGEVADSFEDSSTEETDEDTVVLTREAYKKLKYGSRNRTPKVEKQAPRVEVDDRDERFERLELRADGYSKDEIDEIMALGGTKVLNSKIVQSAIKTMRAEAKSKEASEPLSSKSPVYKKFTQEDFSKMSASEMEKILRE